MQTLRQVEALRISNFILANSPSTSKTVGDICAKRILDGNHDKIPLSWRMVQKNEILIYTEECTISYDLITSELVKAERSDFDLFLAAE